jgi:hypothetical protein
VAGENMRKIIQLTAAWAPDDEEHDAPAQDRLFALCDDGSVHGWARSSSTRPAGKGAGSSLCNGNKCWTPPDELTARQRQSASMSKSTNR